MKILVMGLPGSGKTTLAKQLAESIGAIHINADDIRTRFNDWDFSEEGRKRQAKRMRDFANRSSISVADFICPLQETRLEFDADFIIWMDTIESGRFEDTNQMFNAPTKYNLRILDWEYDLDDIVRCIERENLI